MKGRIKYFALNLVFYFILPCLFCLLTPSSAFSSASDLALTPAPRPDLTLFTRDDFYGPYANVALTSLVPEYQVRLLGQDFFSVLSEPDSVLECFDVQAATAIEQGVGRFWYPQISATVVIAINRDHAANLGVKIKGWRDLLDSNIPVSWTEDFPHPFSFAALAHGIGGRRAAIDFFRRQELAGNFLQEDWTAPIIICFDYQAVMLNRQGRNFEIIVPCEGTLSYRQGLLANHELNLSLLTSPDILLKTGLRLIDGICTDKSYPDFNAYRLAVFLEPDDFQQFATMTTRLRKLLYRKVFQIRLFSSADSTEHVASSLVSAMLALIWLEFSLHRAVRADVRRAIRISGILIISWLLVRLFKYQLYSLSVLGRYCWYSYYIFQIGLSLNVLSLASTFDQPEPVRYPWWLKAIALCYPVLLTIVFTNDLHRFVFDFDINGNWADDYVYRFGFFVIFVYCSAAFIGAVILLAKKSWSSPKRAGWLLPVLLGVLILIYVIGYALEIPLARNSDLATVICLLSMAFLEAAQHTGLISSNTGYSLLFAKSPLNIRLLDQNGKTVLLASSADPLELDSETRAVLQSRSHVKINRDEDTLLFGRAIRAGTVVWQEDITQLNNLYQEIQNSIEKLQAANFLLRQEEEIRRQSLAADMKIKLYTSLEHEIGTRADELSKAIRELTRMQNTQDAIKLPVHERQMTYVTLLLCCIKRRSNLFFLAQEGSGVAWGELSVYLDELSEVAAYAKVRALVQSGINAGVSPSESSDTLSVSLAGLCYDFYYSVLKWSIHESGATLLGQLEHQIKDKNHEQNQDGKIIFRILLSGKISDKVEEINQLLFSRRFCEYIDEIGGTISCKELEDMTSITLTLPDVCEVI